MRRRLLIAAALAGAWPVAAQEPPPAPAAAVAAPLTLDEVLRASARTAPQIVEALARVRASEGRALSAEGAFDTVFDADARSRALGYYSGSVAEARVTRPLTGNGGSLYGSYRASRGDFPIYEDQYYTNKLGEVKVGGLFSLLRDRLIDERRGRRTLAAGDVAVARFEAEATTLGVQRRAVDAYQNWVAAGLRLRAYQGLLALAESRRGALARQVELGARPTILLVENDGNLARRRALVVRSEGELQAAANNLSFFFRDEEGRPITPGPERLPDDEALLARGTPAAVGPDGRPDLQALLGRVEQAATRLALAENELRPRLDLRGELSKDLGEEGLGGRTRTPLEGIVGVRFSVPLQNRAARGRVAEARADIDGLSARERTLRDQITTEVGGIGIAVGAAERVAAIADQERALLERLAAAERRRFDLGSSDFFLVNQREEAATDARVRVIDAEARLAAARAELATAVADRAFLGLEP